MKNNQSANKIKHFFDMGLKSYYKELPRKVGETPKQKFVRELSEECGVAPETVYRWISGTSRPDKLKQKKISEITGIPVEELLNE